MSTTIRAIVSSDSPYYISKERYYELKHFCLQYKDYKKKLALEAQKCRINSVTVIKRTNPCSNDKTGDLATNFAFYGHYTAIIEDCCRRAGGDISKWLFIAVTEGRSYATLNPPCCKDYFYKRYRAFFWMLDKIR